MSYTPRWAEENGVMKPVVSFLHLLPIENNDLPHCGQRCCWCSPKPDDSDPVVIIHNAITKAKSWTIVGEMTVDEEEDPCDDSDLDLDFDDDDPSLTAAERNPSLR